ncbi:MAG TPA: phosphatidylinositol mannoside acyltransferase [Acidimicrobiales bacterium]|jgi:KDO2-lipid IV(A) lauroyltransferase|nr:phosphatidylinositol mannoside acyltransferase [Acidimicrobiales bacterium]
MDRLRERSVFFAYRGAAVLARRVPPALGLAEMVGATLAFSMPERRALIGRHLQRVSGGGLSGLSLLAADIRAFVSYGRYWRDSFRLPGMSPEELDAHMSFEGFEHLAAGLDRGRGVILALPHMGNWDYGGAWLAAIGLPLTAVVERLPGERLVRWFNDRRQAMGMTVVPLGPKAAAKIVAVLRRGGLVGLLSDRELGTSGVTVRFFGEETTLPAGPATLALRTGAALIPVSVLYQRGGRHLAVIRPALDTTRRGSVSEDVARITQALAEELEGLIRRAPEQWHLFQPNWPSDPFYPHPGRPPGEGGDGDARVGDPASPRLR